MGGWMSLMEKQRKQKYIHATDKKMYSLPKLIQQNSFIIYSLHLFFDETTEADKINTRFQTPSGEEQKHFRISQ